MRILFRNLDPGCGGGVSSTCKLLEAYCTKYVDDHLTIMCTRRSPLAALHRFANVEVQVVPSGPMREIQRLTWGTYECRRQLARAAYDIVWCMNVGPYIKTTVPQILSLQNAYQVYPWNVARLHPGTRLRVAALRWFFRRSLRQTDAVIVQTELMKEYVRGIDGCPRRVVVLPKAVTSAPYDTGQPIAPTPATFITSVAGCMTLLYVATYSPHKNHRLLAAMMDLCRRRELPARLVVTLDPKQWSVAGGSGAESLVRSGHVLPVGWVAKDELCQLYPHCDVCVMPSLLESLSSAHLEAMQWRKPQIVADLPYAHDLCGEAAMYADPTDALSWVSCLETLQKDIVLSDRLVRRGKERLRTFPETWTAMADSQRQVFLCVLKNYRYERRTAHEPESENVNAFGE